MAPASPATLFAKRYYSNCDSDGYCYNSTWDSWGRWVALAVIVVAVFLLALTFSCYNSRRRRRRGMAPMYGTGWMGGKHHTGQQHYGYGNNNYYGNGNGNGNYYPDQHYNSGAPVPPYSPPGQATGTAFNGHQGYQGNEGIELTHPQNSYQPQRGGDAAYEPPKGPPPGKEDGIIR